jgi:hypothetical protein
LIILPAFLICSRYSFRPRKGLSAGHCRRGGGLAIRHRQVPVMARPNLRKFIQIFMPNKGYENLSRTLQF